MDAKSCFYLPGGPPENTCHVVIGPMPAAENPPPNLRQCAREVGPSAATLTGLRVNPNEAGCRPG